MLGVAIGLFLLIVACGSAPASTPSPPTPVPPPTRVPAKTLIPTVTPTPVARALPTPNVGATQAAAVRDRIRGTPTTVVRPGPKRARLPSPPAAPGTPMAISSTYGGSGYTILGPFDLVEGVAVLTATHSGESDFSVSIVGEDRDEGLSIKTVGAYAGVRGHSVDPGDSIGLLPGLHTLRVLAAGSWTINIGQKFPLDDTDGTAPPLRLTEQRGDDVLRWVIFAEGVYGIRASHLGAGRFVVELINADGASEILVVNETGNHEGERVLRVGPDSSTSDLAPGFYALVVQAGGDWAINIESQP